MSLPLSLTLPDGATAVGPNPGYGLARHNLCPRPHLMLLLLLSLGLDLTRPRPTRCSCSGTYLPDGHASTQVPTPLLWLLHHLSMVNMKRPDPLGLKCDTITSPRRLVNTFLTSNSTEFK